MVQHGCALHKTVDINFLVVINSDLTACKIVYVLAYFGHELMHACVIGYHICFLGCTETSFYQNFVVRVG